MLWNHLKMKLGFKNTAIAQQEKGGVDHNLLLLRNIILEMFLYNFFQKYHSIGRHTNCHKNDRSNLLIFIKSLKIRQYFE